MQPQETELEQKQKQKWEAIWNEAVINADKPNNISAWAGMDPSSCSATAPRDWQFRMSVFPTRENIAKAARALGNVEQLFASKRPGFKLITLPLDYPDNTSGVFSWDGTLNYKYGTDRDQRGKELCVYMDRGYANEYVFEPEEYKELMLAIWKAMEDAGVEISYITPPIDEAIIPSEQGITTPFCYSSFKPYRLPSNQPHEEDGKPLPWVEDGILLATESNPHHYSDPLEGITITKDDLKRIGIKNWQTAVIAKKRMTYQIAHLNKAKEEIVKELINTNSSQLAKQLEGTWQIDLDSLCEALPHQLDSGLTPLYSKEGMRSFLKDINSRDKELVTKILKNIEVTKEKLLQVTKILGLSIANEQITKAVYNNPFNCQKIYRRLVCCAKEAESISRERAKCDSLLVYEGSQRRWGIVSIVVGVLLSLTVVGALVGVPLIIFGDRKRKRSDENIKLLSTDLPTDLSALNGITTERLKDTLSRCSDSASLVTPVEVGKSLKDIIEKLGGNGKQQNMPKGNNEQTMRRRDSSSQFSDEDQYSKERIPEDQTSSNKRLK